jgi:hypothetical protein
MSDQNVSEKKPPEGGLNKRIKMAETMRFELMVGFTLRTLSKGVV